MYTDHYTRTPVHTRYPRFVRYGLTIIALILIGQSVFQIPLFKITRIHISGVRYLNEEAVYSFVEHELNRRRFIFFKNNNFFITATNRLKQRLENELYVTVTKIDKGFPHTLSLTVDEKISAFALQTQDRLITIGSTGEWVETVVQPSENQTVIADERAIPGSAIDIAYLEALTVTKEEWERSIRPTLVISRFHLTDDSTLIEASTSEGYSVKLRADKGIASQIQRLSAVIEGIAGSAAATEYIDLRFDESVYVK